MLNNVINAKKRSTISVSIIDKEK